MLNTSPFPSLIVVSLSLGLFSYFYNRPPHCPPWKVIVFNTGRHERRGELSRNALHARHVFLLNHRLRYLCTAAGGLRALAIQRRNATGASMVLAILFGTTLLSACSA